MNGSVMNVVCFEWSVVNGSVLNGNRHKQCKYLLANAYFIRSIWCSLPVYLVWKRHTSF